VQQDKMEQLLHLAQVVLVYLHLYLALQHFMLAAAVPVVGAVLFQLLLAQLAEMPAAEQVLQLLQQEQTDHRTQVVAVVVLHMEIMDLVVLM